MLIMAVDTTGSVCSAAISEDKKIITEFYLDHKKTHSEGLMPMVDCILRTAGIEIADIDLFACVTGPGSFTGIRIGVAAVKAFAQAGGKPCVAINTLDALAMNAASFDGVICPILDARRQEVYNALYTCEGGLKRLTEYRALPLEEVLREAAMQKTIFLGDGVRAYRDAIIEAAGYKAVIAAENILLQHASSACLLAYDAALRGETVTAYTLEPFYLRKPQAERVYEESRK